MKKVSMGLIQFILMIFLLFIIVSLSACNVKGNIALNGKDLLVDQLKGLKSHKEATPINDTSNQEQLIGDFRYDNMLK